MSIDIEKLEPCPFCSDDMSSFKPEPNGLARGPGELYVICDCGAMGAGGKTVAEAVATWNRRAAQPAPIPAQTGTLIDQILAYGAACTCMDDRAPAIMEGIKSMLASNALTEEARDAPMTSASNDALLALARHWKLDGDWMTCKGCKRSLIASRDGELLAHGDGCKRWDQHHPWARLRSILTGQQPDVAIASHIKAGQAGKEAA